MSLRRWRESRGWSQEQLAEAIGVRSKGQISQYESGALKPSTDKAIAIDRVSGGAVSVASLRPDLHDVRVIQPSAGT